MVRTLKSDNSATSSVPSPHFLKICSRHISFLISIFRQLRITLIWEKSSSSYSLFLSPLFYHRTAQTSSDSDPSFWVVCVWWRQWRLYSVSLFSMPTSRRSLSESYFCGLHSWGLPWDPHRCIGFLKEEFPMDIRVLWSMGGRSVTYDWLCTHINMWHEIVYIWLYMVVYTHERMYGHLFCKEWHFTQMYMCIYIYLVCCKVYSDDSREC